MRSVLETVWKALLWGDRMLARTIALPLLRVYHIIGSPFFAALGSQCRFYPTCSHYAEDAFRYHGLVRGFLLSSVRLAKCSPLHPGGIDFVPPPKSHTHLDGAFAHHTHTHAPVKKQIKVQKIHVRVPYHV